MLVLTRKPREEIRIGNGITITILRVKGQQVRVGIEAPNDVRIVRGELDLEGGDKENEPASESGDSELPGKAKSSGKTAANPAETTSPVSPACDTERQTKTALPSQPSQSQSGQLSANNRLGGLVEPAVEPSVDSHTIEAEPSISSCRIARPQGGKSVLKILAERQRAKLNSQRAQLGIKIPQN